MRAICLRRSGLSLVCVDSAFHPDGTRVGALTFADNIATLSHGWDFISNPNAREVSVRVRRRASAPIISVPACRAFLTAVSEHHLQSLSLCSFELPSTSLTSCSVGVSAWCLGTKSARLSVFDPGVSFAPLIPLYHQPKPR